MQVRSDDPNLYRRVLYHLSYILPMSSNYNYLCCKILIICKNYNRVTLAWIAWLFIRYMQCLVFAIFLLARNAIGCSYSGITSVNICA